MLATALSSCSTNRYLAEDEILVKQNKLQLSQNSEVRDWKQFRLELAAQTTPQPNGRFFLLFRREGFWLRARERQDSSRFQSFIDRIIAEEPAFLDSTSIEQSRERIRAFMLNRGYFDAEVSYSIDTIRKHAAEVTYTIDSGEPYIFDTILYVSPNPMITALIDQNRDERLLKAGELVDSRLYDQEIIRLVKLIRDNGYANFYANSISPLDADTTNGQFNATLRILPPAEGQTHQQYRVGNIFIFPDVNPLAVSQSVALDTFYDGVRIIYENADFRVEPELLANNVLFRSGQLFDQSAITETNLQLNRQGIFRIVNIQQLESPDQENTIDFYIYLTPGKRRLIEPDAELSFTDRQVVTAGRLSLIGVRAGFNYQDRNLMKGAERLDVNLTGGLEFNIAQLNNPDIQRLNTVELGVSPALSFPRFVDYFGLYRGLKDVKLGKKAIGNRRLIPPGFYATLSQRAISRARFSAAYISLLNFYTSNNFLFDWAYEVPLSSTRRVQITHLGLGYTDITTQPLFEELRQAQPFLQRSYYDVVSSGFLFRQFSFVNLGKSTPGRSFFAYSFELEQSGAELYGVNSLVNALGSGSGAWQIGSGLDYARYLRFSGRTTFTIPFGTQSSLVANFTSGIARSYGPSQEIDVPYDRQFFAGGNNSLRGWPPRALGPGGFEDTLAQNTERGFLYYQTGDLKLEFNLEYRDFLTSLWATRWDYAIFVDAGNIWTLSNDPSRPGSQFRFTELIGQDGQVVNEAFYNQVAINTGAGLRIDFKYALFRLDVGVKLRNPYPINGTHWPSSFEGRYNGRLAYQIGLNYPF